MLSPLRNRFGIPGVLSVIALVFAMLGGAYAANHRASTKANAGLTAKQKKEVKKLAEQYAGRDGANGAAGVNGSPGAKGANGSPGADGKSVLINGTAPGCGSAGGVTIEVQGIPASAKQVCNGADGGSGLDGKSMVATPVPAEEEEENCEGRGGLEVEVEDEGSPTYICNGSVGQDAGFNYAFNSAIAATDPGAGKLALNNASAGSATKLSISETDANSNSLAAAIANWVTGSGAQGTLMIRKAGAPATFAEYTIVANKDEGAFDNLEVTFVAGHGTLANNDPVTIAYWAGATTTLPKGAVESGRWTLSGSSSQERVLVPLSLQTPLTTAIEDAQIHIQGESGFSTVCGPSSFFRPRPVNSNELCIYGEWLGTLEGVVSETFPEGSITESYLSQNGGFLVFRQASPGEVMEGIGSFAVKG